MFSATMSTARERCDNDQIWLEDLVERDPEPRREAFLASAPNEDFALMSFPVSDGRLASHVVHDVDTFAEEVGARRAAFMVQCLKNPRIAAGLKKLGRVS